MIANTIQRLTAMRPASDPRSYKPVFHIVDSGSGAATEAKPPPEMFRRSCFKCLLGARGHV